MPSYHEKHICLSCGQQFGQHAGDANPFCLPGTCPNGKEPRLTGDVERDDEALKRFWSSKTTFSPK